jgi:hypothetical protein
MALRSPEKTALRIALLVGAAGLLVVASSFLREKRLAVETTTQQIEDTLAALDPASRAAVIARLTADAGEHVKDRLDR